jgi:hypothetical protein
MHQLFTVNRRWLISCKQPTYSMFAVCESNQLRCTDNRVSQDGCRGKGSVTCKIFCSNGSWRLYIPLRITWFLVFVHRLVPTQWVVSRGDFPLLHFKTETSGTRKVALYFNIKRRRKSGHLVIVNMKSFIIMCFSKWTLNLLTLSTEWAKSHCAPILQL